MSATIRIELSPGAIALIEKFRAMPSEFPQAIKRGMDLALQIVSGRIQEKRLSGVGPFATEEHRLGQVTGQLSLRTRATESTVISEGEQITVEGAIGSSVKYAAIHEFGGVITPKSAKTLAFTIGDKKVFTKKVVVPERAPFRTGITENVDYIGRAIERELVATLETK